MKNKYQRLSKQEKKQAVKDYTNESDKNKSYMATLNRLQVLGVIGLVYGILSSILDLLVMHPSVFSYIIDAIIIIFTVFILVQRNRFKTDTLNFYLIEKAKQEEKPKKRKHVSKNAKAKKDQVKKEK